jgi:hypothetical protein
MAKKRKIKKIKRKLLKLLSEVSKQLKLIPPKYWNKQF